MAIDDRNSPIFIVCCARSGSTLLRYVVDSHPVIGCPPELHISELCRNLLWTYGLALDQPKKNSIVIRKCRKVIDGMMSDYLQRVEKSRWCDKSISTVNHLNLVQSIFPDAKFLFLFRSCMDVVHSALEVSRYGYSGYGFSSYVAKNPGNTVAAIMDYWCEKAKIALDFEEKIGTSGFRVRYEDLVSDPDATIAGIVQFLGLDPVADHVSKVFSTSHQGGPGDSNIVFTRRIEREGVGKGSTIPLGTIPRRNLEKANALLTSIGYPIIDESSSRGASVHVPAGSAAVDSKNDVADETQPGPSSLLTELCKMMHRGDSTCGAIKFVFDDQNAGVWRLVLENGSTTVDEGDHDADCEVHLPLSSLAAIVAGNVNPMKLLHTGNLRIFGDADFARRAFVV